MRLLRLIHQIKISGGFGWVVLDYSVPSRGPEFLTSSDA